MVGTSPATTFPSWQVGRTVGYPLGRSTADANLARARLERSQTEAWLREIEIRVAAAARDVRPSRDHRSTARRGATRVARELAERRLEAEQRRFDVALSTSLLVFPAQRDRTVARNDELLATLDYLKSLVDFDAVQEAPLINGQCPNLMRRVPAIRVLAAPSRGAVDPRAHGVATLGVRGLVLASPESTPRAGRNRRPPRGIAMPFWSSRACLDNLQWRAYCR